MPIRGDRLRWPPRPGKRSVGHRETLATDEQQPSPRQPNERDASADSQGEITHPSMQQAHDDLAAGQRDTDCRNSAVEIIERKPLPKGKTR